MSGRIVTSIRMDKTLKKRFLEAVQEKGFSTCFIIETLIRAWLASAEPPSVVQSSSLIVHQKIEYLVERPRRNGGGGLIRKPLENCYLHGCWSYRKPFSDEVLSQLGHVTECECNVCKPFVARAQYSRSIRAENMHLIPSTK